MNIYPWQAPAIEKALAAPGVRYLCADEMGLGKTREVIEIAKRLALERLFVVAPALARRTWAIEIEKWAPELGGVGVVWANPDREDLPKRKREVLVNALRASVRVVSPELLSVDRERLFLTKNTGVVIDEAHYYTNAKAARSEALERCLQGFSGPIIGATATPIPNRVGGLWNLLNLLCPGRYGFRTNRKHGVPFAFLEAYAERLTNKNGNVVWGGLRPDRAQELAERLSWIMSRTTRSEVRRRWPGIIPQCQLKPLPVDIGGVRATTVAWAEDAIEGASHIAILTNRRQTARDSATALAVRLPGVPVLHVDGGTPSEERDDKIAVLHKAPRGILVSTMHAVKESIPLTWCHRALIAELYWRPATLVQLIGRFPRVGGDADILLEILCAADSIQMKMALAIADKLMDQQKLLPEGAAEGGLLSALSSNNMEDELLSAATKVSSGFQVNFPEEEL